MTEFLIIVPVFLATVIISFTVAVAVITLIEKVVENE
jgi:hypothetical protein